MRYKIYFLAALLLGVFTLDSCKKGFLDQQAPDILTTDNFWRNKGDALSGLAAAYSQLNHFIGWDNYIEARSVREYYRSDYVKPGADAYNYAWWMENYNFNFTSGNYAISLLWSDDYRGINFANQVIENVGKMTADKIDEASQKEIIAEARFLRAWYYFDLVKNFQKVVLRDKVPTSDADIPLEFADRKSVWNFIIADLEAAEKDLPKRSQRPATEMGRATKGAAQGYLGKVYLYRASDAGNGDAGDYKLASDWLQKVVDSKEYSLDDDFLGMFDGTNSNSNESVFELQQSANTTNGAYYKSYLSAWVGATELNGYGEIYGTQRLLDEMLKEGKEAQDGRYDNRVYQTMYFNCDYFNEPAGNVYGYTYDDVFGKDANMIAFRKWIPDDYTRMQQSNAINMPLMRYSDVLLMLAESLNNQDKSADAVPYINLVRAVHGKMPPLTQTDKQAVSNEIIHERVMEFTLEGSRFYDLRRWGMLDSVMKAAGRSFHMDKAYYPVPIDEIHNNPDAK